MRLLLLDKPTKEVLKHMRESFTIVKANPDIIYTQLTPVTCDVPVFCPCTGVNHVHSPYIVHLYDKEWLFDNIWATAEHTWSLLLALVKNLDSHMFVVHTERDSTTPMSKDLHGRRMLIVGYGRVGRQVARYAHAFGMTVDTIEKGFNPELIADKLNRADVVSFHIPLDGNEELVDGRWFSQMQKGTIVLNTSRSGIMNERSVKGWCKYLTFGLDTVEGYSDDVIQELCDNKSFITPHVGGYSDKSREATDMWILERMLEYKRRHG